VFSELSSQKLITFSIDNNTDVNNLMKDLDAHGFKKQWSRALTE